MRSDARELPSTLTPAQRAVIAHVTAFFADRSVEVSEFDEGPMRQRVPELEQRFDDARLHYWDTGRPAIV